MISKTFSVMIFVSVVCSLFTGNFSQLSYALLSSLSRAVSLCISLLGMMCFWSGVMNVFVSLKAFSSLEKFLLRPIKLIFGKKGKDEETAKCITASFVSNLLGLGNASLPAGIKTMEHLQKGEREGVPCDESILFCLLCAFPLQLVPSSLAVLRQSAGSKNPLDVLPLVWICNIITQLFAIILCKLLSKNSKKEKDR